MCAFKNNVPTDCYFTYKEHVYKVISRDIRMKDSDGKWYDAVSYTRADITSQTYVRRAEDFDKLFVPIYLEGPIGNNVHIR